MREEPYGMDDIMHVCTIDIADTLRYLLLGSPDGTQEIIEVKLLYSCSC